MMKTRILITIGDINGIGPETILKALNNKSIINKYDITVLSPFSVIEYYSRLFKMKMDMDKFSIIPIGNENVKIKPGKITRESGFISGLAITAAIELCLAKEYDAFVTAPISKEALNLGGFKYDGHTEMLTDLRKAKDSVMFMISDKINMAFASTHPPLKKAASIVTKKLLDSKISICYNSLKKDLGINKPEIGVLALNPHAGDGGVIGDEEIRIISPAFKSMRNRYKGAEIDGPFPADSYFANKTYTKYDLTFAMYHDQGFIPFKMIAGHHGTNFTAGLSFIRTSPDHGTAFDIAGKGFASEVSIVEAIKTGDRIFKNQQKNKGS